MSGLDGLGWPNPEDEPKPKETMNSQLEIKLAPTPETDAMEYFDAMCDPDRVVEADFARKLERERDAAQKAMGDARDILLDAMPDANAPTKILAEMIVAERDILKEHISIMDISHKTANDEYFKLAAENEKLERERNEWKAKYIQQNKDLGCEQMDPNGTIWDYAKKVQHELTVVTKQRDQLEGKLCFELGGHPDSKLWGETGLIAATMRCVDAIDEVTEQRDDAREQLRKAQVENDHNWQAIEMYEAERALADRLALALKMTRWDSPVTCKKALAAWKEVRSES